MLPELKVLKGHIILPLVDPVAFAKVFPTVKTAKVNGSYVAALPHDVATMRLLRNRGYNVPSLLSSYNWPGKFTPYAHQKVTTDFFVVNPRAYCLSGMGTCKSASALWATDYLMRQGEVKKTLIVAPLSTLDRVWAQELFHVLPHRRFHILHGSRQKRMELLSDLKCDFYIINHDGVEIIADALAKRPDINHVIYDELAAARNARTHRARTMFAILNRQNIPRSAWGLTGTPTPTAPTDCFGHRGCSVRRWSSLRETWTPPLSGSRRPSPAWAGPCLLTSREANSERERSNDSSVASNTACSRSDRHHLAHRQGEARVQRVRW